MRRVVIVSNRVADPEGVASGGLAVCVLDALRKHDAMWFGWNGDVVANEIEFGPACRRYDNLTQVTIPLSERDYKDCYLGFCNAALWPVHHYRLDLAHFTPESSEAYKRVNDRFAEDLVPILNASDLVWAHDYHLIPLGAALRKRGMGNRIGFFLHIPFPPPDIWVAMPEHEWLMSAFLEYDLVGFQTKTDLANFCRFVCDVMGGEMTSADTLHVAGKTLTASVFPVGIDVASVTAMASSAEAEKCIQRLHGVGEPRINIIGVDRLDYTKGLPDRLRSFKRLLELYPQNGKAVTLMQIAPPTREHVQAYADIRHELESLSGEINGQFGDFDWTPVRYIHRNVPRDTLAALYRGSQVGLVTPLRDGMNLVAKEYVAAQREENPGVLVMSRFAGAAEDLEEALVVNPYDADEVANAIQRAITMPREERIERRRALMARIQERDACNWMTGFLRALAALPAGAISTDLRSTATRRRRLASTATPTQAKLHDSPPSLPNRSTSISSGSSARRGMDSYQLGKTSTVSATDAASAGA